MKRRCEKCGKITEHHSIDEHCLECSDNPSDQWLLRRIRQYKEWTGNEEWEFTNQEYSNLLSKKMYDMAVEGISVPEIAKNVEYPQTGVYSQVIKYCRKNSLTIPFEKRTVKRRKTRIVRQCPICKIIDATCEGSGYEVICPRCTNFPDESKRRTQSWIQRECESAEKTKERRNQSYPGSRSEIITECQDELFFGYMKIDFTKRIITPIGKRVEDMQEIVWDFKRAWEQCRPQSTPFVLKDGTKIESRKLFCPAIAGISLKGPDGISAFLVPVDEWEISVDLRDWWFDIQGEMTSFLSMKFSDWLRRQYVEKKLTIEEIASDANATIYQVEFALNELSIPLRDYETFR